MRIDESAIREVVARSDIAAVIGQYVSLRKRGNDLVGLCPFHGEKTPSFHVHPDRGFFKCFGCGVGGDVIRFVSRIENVPFPDAVRLLARRVGVELEPETPATARARSEREAIYEANDIAAKFFHRMLLSDAGGENARAYCARRGLEVETIERFHLGFAPDRWDALASELARNGVAPETAISAGLLKPGQRGPYDFYRGRLMIPTRSTTGEVVAFGGRALGDEEPKYLNTATTPVYTKGRYLYALDIARRAVAERDALIVVEGYLDCIALHVAGFPNTVAALGTAFTPEQAALVHKYTRHVFLCYDADKAGEAATAKSLAVLKEADVAARIVQLPAGDDPDSFVRREGSPALQVLLDASPLGVQFEVDRQLERIESGFTTAAEIARNAEALVRSLPREEWDRWRTYVAQRLRLDVDDLRKSRFLIAAPATVRAPNGARSQRPQAGTAPSFERDVLAIATEDPELLGEYASRIPPERFADERLREIYTILLASAATLAQPSDVLSLFGDDGETVDLLTAVVRPERSGTVRFIDRQARRAHLDRIVEWLCKRDDEQRRLDLRSQIDELLGSGQPVPAELRDEEAALTAKLKK